jgi:hypothetical protein
VDTGLAWMPFGRGDVMDLPQGDTRRARLHAVRRFARWAMRNTTFDRHHCVRWGVDRLQKGLLPLR